MEPDLHGPILKKAEEAVKNAQKLIEEWMWPGPGAYEHVKDKVQENKP